MIHHFNQMSPDGGRSKGLYYSRLTRWKDMELAIFCRGMRVYCRPSRGTFEVAYNRQDTEDGGCQYMKGFGWTDGKWESHA